jgi:hypothetical protein
MRAISLVDLDDTLFQTLRKCPPDMAVETLTPVGFTADGAPISYATSAQRAFIEWLTDTTHFVPVTARSLAALRRVRLPYGAAVCAHGGMILDENGDVDLEWDAHIRTQATAHSTTINALVAALNDAATKASLPVHARVQMEGDIGLYPLARHEAADVVALNAVANGVLDQLPEGWTDHRNSNVIAFLPPFLGKQHAVARILPALRARHTDAMVIGIGDSLTDALFMDLCDFAMMPNASQLARAVKTGLFSA